MHTDEDNYGEVRIMSYKEICNLGKLWFEGTLNMYFNSKIKKFKYKKKLYFQLYL